MFDPKGYVFFLSQFGLKQGVGLSPFLSQIGYALYIGMKQAYMSIFAVSGSKKGKIKILGI